MAHAARHPPRPVPAHRHLARARSPPSPTRRRPGRAHRQLHRWLAGRAAAVVSDAVPTISATSTLVHRGAVGEPGRADLLPAGARARPARVTVKCEKQQVAALAEYLGALLADLPATERPALDPARPASRPTTRRWFVSARSASAYDADPTASCVVLEEVVADRRGGRDPIAEAANAGRPCASHLTRDQATAFCRRAAELVAAGRPACRFCGRPDRPRRASLPAHELSAMRLDRRSRLLARRRGRGRGPHAVELQRHVPRHASAPTTSRRRRSTSRCAASGRCGTSPPGCTGARSRPGSCPRRSAGHSCRPRRARRAVRRGLAAAVRAADFEQHYFTLYEDRPDLHDQLRAICAFDLLANNTDRKSGHCLLGLDGSVWAIDNGLCFAAEFKLRTVIWEFGGEPMPDDAPGRVASAVPTACRRRSPTLLDDDETRGAATPACAPCSCPARVPGRPTGHRYPWPLV